MPDVHTGLYVMTIANYSPISVRKSSTTTGGPISGNISENVDANMMANTQAPVAKEGLYVLGYTAECSKLNQLFGRHDPLRSPRNRCRGVIACFSARSTCHSRIGCSNSNAGQMMAAVMTIVIARALI